jgi:hypothetical protein
VANLWTPRAGRPVSMLPRAGRGVAAAVILAATCAGCSGSGGQGPARQRPAAATHPAPPGGQAIAPFTGQWSGHDSYIAVKADGRFTLSMRTFRTCGQEPPPCDTFSGNEILDGSVATGQITAVSGEAASAVVTHTTDQALTPTGDITLTLDPASDTITADDVSYCGPSAPAGACGA